MNKLRTGCRGIVCLLVGLLITLLIESMFVLGEREIPLILFPAMVVAFSGLLFVSGSWKKLVAVFASVCGFSLIIVLILWGNISEFSSVSNYRNADSEFGMKTFFTDQKIMLIVPHQDDDLNVLGGTIEEFVHYGSDVYVVYLTNGDMTPAEFRYAEAIACLEKQGVPEDHVIFMGYGDQWQEDGPHIYNADPGTVVQSRAGFFATYGTSDHPPYHDGVDYTIENLLADMESIIMEYMPDVIFSCDYDEHSDHKAISLIFDKVMGRILKSGSDYQPRVFKGFAYRTAWNGVFDFYSLNIKSTKNKYEVGFKPQIEYYRWEDRVRFPVNASTLSRSLLGSGLYDCLNAYTSQHAYQKALGIINGDKVFWERFTTSICNRAIISATSGEPELLNDFMILDNDDVVDKDRMPYDGVWIPEPMDEEKTVSVILPEVTDLSSIVLYDHPSPEQNILEAVIRFDNGDLLTVGPLDPIGAPTVIDVQQKQVSSFQVELSLTEGADAGLSELEAFTGSRENTKGFVQLMDMNDEFVYDYITEPSGETVLQLYAYGKVPAVGPENYKVYSDNERCSVKWSEQGIAVACPPGENAVISVVSQDESVWDRVYIHNPGWLNRARIKACQLTELFGLDIPENYQREEILNHFAVRRFQTKLWNLHYRLTH